MGNLVGKRFPEVGDKVVVTHFFVTHDDDDDDIALMARLTGVTGTVTGPVSYNYRQGKAFGEGHQAFEMRVDNECVIVNMDLDQWKIVDG